MEGALHLQTQWNQMCSEAAGEEDLIPVALLLLDIADPTLLCIEDATLCNAWERRSRSPALAQATEATRVEFLNTMASARSVLRHSVEDVRETLLYMQERLDAYDDAAHDDVLLHIALARSVLGLADIPGDPLRADVQHAHAARHAEMAALASYRVLLRGVCGMYRHRIDDARHTLLRELDAASVTAHTPERPRARARARLASF